MSSSTGCCALRSGARGAGLPAASTPCTAKTFFARSILRLRWSWTSPSNETSVLMRLHFHRGTLMPFCANTRCAWGREVPRRWTGDGYAGAVCGFSGAPPCAAGHQQGRLRWQGTAMAHLAIQPQVQIRWSAMLPSRNRQFYPGRSSGAGRRGVGRLHYASCCPGAFAGRFSTHGQEGGGPTATPVCQTGPSGLPA